MTVEQKPGCGVCIRNPREAWSALKAKIIIGLTNEGAGTSRVLRTTPEIMAQEGLSLPEITAKLARKSQTENGTFVTEASQIEDSTL
jgi:hypothetical protein